uniref:Uncharacterized protein n=1 Tax=Ditylum brightwellii TaxID=49249 RepID=A0A7S1Z4U9_9STRA|mmetsp:Transcript_24474/g.36515  ORF Transcript_24474/g.36515 Transcript_24474/m.36515 type:complete len:252 (+) Transcript_24474:98-853(+)
MSPYLQPCTTYNQHTAKQKEILTTIAGNSGLRRLYQQQLQSLREYYGRRYESILDDEDLWNQLSIQEGDDSSKERKRKLKAKREEILTKAASISTEGFRVAAQNAIPHLCRRRTTNDDDNNHDEDSIATLLYNVDGGYDYTSILHGLLQDMMEATSLREDVEEEWEDATSPLSWDEDYEEDEPEEEEGTRKKRLFRLFRMKKRKGPVKWYEKLAARALVLSVNYLQGWLALQGIRRAAAERDESMPKFPLF